MQFSVVITAILSAVAVPAVLAAETDCCWGKGQKSCMNQNGDSVWCASNSANFCYNVMKQGTNTPVSATCDADCCDTVTGWGIGCPK
ncbi:hypothetical protein COL5a_001700 [Colletotrichum fioriniae]|nr:uncharacterized protein COL516b_002778 [Colletotrichum fioriniae]KAJ0309532.1 hypothetical protein COL516b_002778 [Colletotrichum fioriniae]KAJ0332971.1 hypothetical protein COL5a_001700 [Colletotrichum fioriniae]